jgi:DNA processing protein
MADSSIQLSAPVDIITATDPRWPRKLADLSTPPLWLRVAGKMSWPEPVIAIVGTRHADDDAEEFTRSLAAHICAAGCTVIAGGAYGIDAAAHQGALSAHGYTIAVLATGLTQAYPPSHGPLFTQIAKRGALITEATDSQSPRPGLFLKRNRLIAAMADAVVVVQAPLRSGALSTARWAKELARPLFAVPSSPWNPRGQGCLHLIEDGAGICTSAEDILSVLFENVIAITEKSLNSAERRPSFPDDMDEATTMVLNILNSHPRYPDEIARLASLSVERVQRSLLILVVSGLIDELTGGRYARTSR